MMIRQPVRILTMLVLVLGLGSMSQVHAAPTAIKGEETFTLEPGGTATIAFESFCLDYGKQFPTSVTLPPTGQAEAKVLSAISYALSKDYTTSAPKEVQYAIWQARGATGSPALGAQGTEIAQNTAAASTAPSGATSLIDALSSNKIKATAGTWNGVGEKLTINNQTDFFQGKGELKIENTSQETLTLYMPNGTVFPAPAAEFQSMAGYATDIQVNNPQRLPNTGIVSLSALQLAMLAVAAFGLTALGYTIRQRSTS